MNGIFAVNKPVGPTSRETVDILKFLLSKQRVLKKLVGKAEVEGPKARKHKKLIKIGHGGTLDPLASGVLIIGVGDGTRRLSAFLNDCSKTYRAIAMFGTATTTFDSEGEAVTHSSVSHLTNELILEALEKFRGDIMQYPPAFSALKMDGKPLYYYARNNLSLPKPIEARPCRIDDIEIVGSGLKTEHEFKSSLASASEETKKWYDAHHYHTGEIDKNKINYLESAPSDAPIVEIEFTVSSGTYIRSLINDLGIALNTTAHMVALERVSQGPFELGKNVFEMGFFDESQSATWLPVLLKTLNKEPTIPLDVIKQMVADEKEHEKSYEDDENDDV